MPFLSLEDAYGLIIQTQDLRLITVFFSIILFLNKYYSVVFFNCLVRNISCEKRDNYPDLYFARPRRRLNEPIPALKFIYSLATSDGNATPVLNESRTPAENNGELTRDNVQSPVNIVAWHSSAATSDFWMIDTTRQQVYKPPR
jgi:hypothetical protein